MQKPVTFHKTGPDDPEFRALIRQLDADLHLRYGAAQAAYNAFNTVDTLFAIVLARVDGHAAACGALKRFDNRSFEIKRVFTSPDFRGRGVGSALIAELERLAREAGAARCVLETGTRQTEAIALYRKLGYSEIPNYPPYTGMELSICFERAL